MLSSSNDLQIIELWLQGRASAHTRSCYRRDVGRMLTSVGKQLNHISLGDLQAFTESLIAAGLAPVSRVRTIAALKSFFGFCCRTRHLGSNPAAELALPCYEKRLAERIVSEEDIQRMLAAQDQPRDKTLLRLLYSAGLRVSEVCGLRWRNLSARGDAGQITVFGKNGRTRSIALTAPLWRELNALRGAAARDEPVFRSRTGKPLDRGRVRIIVRQAAERTISAESQQSFATEKELAQLAADWPGYRLVEIWNSFAGAAPFDDLKAVKKFTNRNAAVGRIWLAVQRLSPTVANRPLTCRPSRGRRRRPSRSSPSPPRRKRARASAATRKLK